ncbi:Reverse transcriptase [Phytophthora palmivora]|uniref:Reverse transcriptase n=1 Tax=Phytophthora palmivora TaxID=4796 RepID=A0A2P4Y1V4_9STRA|nr:Reverse transcriptase [Phytophthora palmivora]
MRLSGDRIPPIPGYVSVESRRNDAEWQNVAYQATADEISEVDINEQITEPPVERPEYVTPTAILPRPLKASQNVQVAGDGDASPPPSKCTSDQGKIDPDNSDNLRAKIEKNIGDFMMDDEVCFKEGGSLFAEDEEDQMAVLPEVTAITEEVEIEDLQISDDKINTQEEIERLVQIIWKRKHLLIGKGNAFHQRQREWSPVAQRCRKVVIQFREKLYQLSKGLLSARMILVIIKKNWIDIRLCIDYHLINNLTRLMVYPMPLINDLLDDLDKWFLGSTHDRPSPIDLERNESVLGRRSYIGDILVTGRSRDALRKKVETPLDACDEWNLYISVVKKLLGSAKGLETHPKDLSALQELPFPINLRSMQSFIGSLNYYSRFIEYFAIYASVLYELREADFYEITRRTKSTGDDVDVMTEENGRWTEARTTFAILKNKIVTAPILRHFDVDRQPAVVVYASKWAI